MDGLFVWITTMSLRGQSPKQSHVTNEIWISICEETLPGTARQGKCAALATTHDNGGTNA